MSASEPIRERKEPFRFRLLHVFYAMAILGASLATCGVGGIFVAAAILGIWFAVFWGNWPTPEMKDKPPEVRSFTLAELLVVIAVIAVLIALLLPAVRTARSSAIRSHCSNNLKQIALALHNYYDTYGSVPPAYIADENGKPMHSWRVLILPFLESNTIYDRYRFDEPWDGPNNRTLLPEVPDVYQCPAHARRHGDITTSYFAVIGPNTAWPGADSRRFSEVFSPFNKILLLEGPPQKIAWSEPKDLSLEEAVALFSETSHPNGGHIDDDGFFYTTMLGRNCALADGAVRWLPPVLPPRFAEHLLRFDGELTSEEFDNLPMYYPRRLKWDNLLRLAILICLTALPLPWAIALWRKRLTAEAPLSAVHEQA